MQFPSIEFFKKITKTRSDLGFWAENIMESEQKAKTPHELKHFYAYITNPHTYVTHVTKGRKPTARSSHAEVPTGGGKTSIVHYLLEEIPEKYSKQISADDFYLPRLRYVETAPYTKDEFERAYNWMVTWDLVGADATYDDLVCNRI